MQDKSSRNQEKPSQVGEREMTTAAQVQDEISTLLRRLASPVEAGESVKCCIRRASQRSGLPATKTKKLWYREIRSIPAHIADIIRARAAAHDRKLRRSMYQAVVAMQECDPTYFSQCIEDVGEAMFLDGNKAGQTRNVD